MTWAHRLRRVFKIEIETCETCGAKMKVNAAIEDPAGVSAILCVRRVSHLDTGEAVTIHDGELIHRRSPFLGLSYFVSQDIS